MGHIEEVREGTFDIVEALRVLYKERTVVLIVLWPVNRAEVVELCNGLFPVCNLGSSSKMREIVLPFVFDLVYEVVVHRRTVEERLTVFFLGLFLIPKGLCHYLSVKKFDILFWFRVEVIRLQVGFVSV